MYYPSSENKDADQLRGYREADLRICFRLGRLLVFPWGGSNYVVMKISRTKLVEVQVNLNVKGSKFSRSFQLIIVVPIVFLSKYKNVCMPSTSKQVSKYKNVCMPSTSEQFSKYKKGLYAKH